MGSLTHPQSQRSLKHLHRTLKPQEPWAKIFSSVPALSHCRYHCPLRQQSPFIKIDAEQDLYLPEVTQQLMGQDKIRTWVSWLPGCALHPLGDFVQCSQRLNVLCLPLRQSWGQGWWLLILLPSYYDSAWATAAVNICRRKGFLAPQSSHPWKLGIMGNSMNSSWVTLSDDWKQRHSPHNFFPYKSILRIPLRG